MRSTGSGMGCPDWPKCFGLLVPPTTVEEIPSAFFEKHKDDMNFVRRETKEVFVAGIGALSRNSYPT